MSLRAFELAAGMHDSILKEAFLLPAARVAKGLAGLVAKRPGAALNAAFTGSQLADETKKLTRLAQQARQKIGPTGPTM